MNQSISQTARITRVYKSLNKPLTIWGVERRLFFGALIVGAATFNFFNSLLGGLVMFALLYTVARWATGVDPDVFRIVFNAAKGRAVYDPLKFENDRGDAKP